MTIMIFGYFNIINYNFLVTLKLNETIEIIKLILDRKNYILDIEQIILPN